MEDHSIEVPELSGYVSVKEAAKELGISSKRVYTYIEQGRLRAVRVGGSLAVLQEDVESFQPNITGRPRKGSPLWHTPPSDNRLRMTLIIAQVKAGQREKLIKRLEEIRQSGAYLFSGSIARYIAESETIAGQIEIELVWRGVAPQTEARIEQELETFKRALDDVLDWSKARYSTSKILLHTSGQ